MELYTCEDGIWLFENGHTFGAWTKKADSYRHAEKNYKILVDEKDVVKHPEEEEGYEVFNISSVEVVGEDDVMAVLH